MTVSKDVKDMGVLSGFVETNHRNRVVVQPEERDGYVRATLVDPDEVTSVISIVNTDGTGLVNIYHKTDVVMSIEIGRERNATILRTQVVHEGKKGW